MRINVGPITRHWRIIEIIASFNQHEAARSHSYVYRSIVRRVYVVPRVGRFQRLIWPRGSSGSTVNRRIANDKITLSTTRLVERYRYSVNLVSVASLPDMASPAVGIVKDIQRVRRVALNTCNLIVAGKFRSESRPLICDPVLCRVDNLTPISTACYSTLVKAVRIIHVPRIISCRASEWTGYPLEHRAISLKLITGLSRRYSIEGIVMKHCYSAANTANAK